MVRARMLRLALAAGLGLASGCSTCSQSSFFNRLLHPFRSSEPATVIGDPVGGPIVEGGFGEGPVIVDPGLAPPACPPALPPGPPIGMPAVPPSSPPAAPPSAAPESAPPPRAFPSAALHRMPYQY